MVKFLFSRFGQLALAMAVLLASACAPAAPSTPTATQTNAPATATEALASTPTKLAPTSVPATSTPTLLEKIQVLSTPAVLKNMGKLERGSDMGTQVFALLEDGEAKTVGCAPRHYRIAIPGVAGNVTVEYTVLNTDSIADACNWAKEKYPQANHYWLGLNAFKEGTEMFLPMIPRKWEIVRAPAKAWGSERASNLTYDNQPVDAFALLRTGVTTLATSKYETIEEYIVCNPLAKGAEVVENTIPTEVNPYNRYTLAIIMAPDQKLNLETVCAQGIKSAWGWRHIATDSEAYDRSLHARRLTNALLERLFSEFDAMGNPTPGKLLIDQNMLGSGNFVRLILGEQDTGPMQLAPDWMTVYE